MTPHGMPAFASASSAARRSSGVDARGSMTRASSASSVVMETKTDAAWTAASSPRRSMSRVTRWFFVMIDVGFLNSFRTARHRRVISSFRSIGW